MAFLNQTKVGCRHNRTLASGTKYYQSGDGYIGISTRSLSPSNENISEFDMQLIQVIILLVNLSELVAYA